MPHPRRTFPIACQPVTIPAWRLANLVMLSITGQVNLTRLEAA